MHLVSPITSLWPTSDVGLHYALVLRVISFCFSASGLSLKEHPLGQCSSKHSTGIQGEVNAPREVLKQCRMRIGT